MSIDLGDSACYNYLLVNMNSERLVSHIEFVSQSIEQVMILFRTIFKKMVVSTVAFVDSPVTTHKKWRVAAVTAAELLLVYDVKVIDRYLFGLSLLLDKVLDSGPEPGEGLDHTYYGAQHKRLHVVKKPLRPSYF